MENTAKDGEGVVTLLPLRMLGAHIYEVTMVTSQTAAAAAVVAAAAAAANQH